MIACLLFPYFASSIERRLDASLITSPLVITDSAQTPERVYAVSAEAASYGVKPGMRLRQAQALCPECHFIPASPAQYQQVLNEILTLLSTFTTKVEPDNSQLATTVYLDLGPSTGAEYLDLAKHISQTLRQETHFTPALGLARGKFPAYIASGSIGLNRVLLIPPGQQRSFLAPLSVEFLPFGPNDTKLPGRFSLLGLRTMGQFAKLPAGLVLTQFGQPGRLLHDLARGRDDRPVTPYQPEIVEQAFRQLDGPVTDRTVLIALGRDISIELAARLERRGRVARVLELTLHLEDDRQWQKQLVLRQPVGQAERLALNLASLLEQARPACGVVAVTVKLSDLISVSARQLDLFTNPNLTEQAKRLNELLPNLVARFGPDCFYEVTLTNQLANLPEGRFQLRVVDRL